MAKATKKRKKTVKKSSATMKGEIITDKTNNKTIRMMKQGVSKVTGRIEISPFMSPDTIKEHKKNLPEAPKQIFKFVEKEQDAQIQKDNTILKINRERVRGGIVASWLPYIFGIVCIHYGYEWIGGGTVVINIVLGKIYFGTGAKNKNK